MPTATNNKVKYGLKNVYYVPITAFSDDNVPTYGTPVRYPGAVNLSMDPSGEHIVFRADDIDYWEANGGEAGYDGTFEAALVPDSFAKDILGDAVDPNGLQYDDANAEIKHFALLFEIIGDVKRARHVFYNCTATKPSTGSETTPEGSPTPITESIGLHAAPVHFSTVGKDVTKAKCYYGDTAYSTFFTTVAIPAAGASA
jgi:phi13 family phage major tail protein